ncbi:MAG: hypothetical protein EP298_09210 [Gammaproteobacteria bacterium]|nr:MAG: hypothetical protein EP298_09210 [Gammaproteobacteria bacterium]UTW42340.1 hypothetical protein KFE69_12775 [bacterium SCSIO 12844]
MNYIDRISDAILSYYENMGPMRKLKGPSKVVKNLHDMIEQVKLYQGESLNDPDVKERVLKSALSYFFQNLPDKNSLSYKVFEAVVDEVSLNKEHANAIKQCFDLCSNYHEMGYYPDRQIQRIIENILSDSYEQFNQLLSQTVYSNQFPWLLNLREILDLYQQEDYQERIKLLSNIQSFDISLGGDAVRFILNKPIDRAKIFYETVCESNNCYTVHSGPTQEDIDEVYERIWNPPLAPSAPYDCELSDYEIEGIDDQIVPSAPSEDGLFANEEAMRQPEPIFHMELENDDVSRKNENSY